MPKTDTTTPEQTITVDKSVLDQLLAGQGQIQKLLAEVEALKAGKSNADADALANALGKHTESILGQLRKEIREVSEGDYNPTPALNPEGEKVRPRPDVFTDGQGTPVEVRLNGGDLKPKQLTHAEIDLVTGFVRAHEPRRARDGRWSVTFAPGSVTKERMDIAIPDLNIRGRRESLPPFFALLLELKEDGQRIVDLAFVYEELQKAQAEVKALKATAAA